MESTKRTVEVVIMATDGGAFLLFDARGTNYVAASDEELARWMLRIATDPDTPQVPFGSPSEGAWTKAAQRILAALDTRAPEPANDELVGVHVVVQCQDEPWCVVVWPPKGPPRTALSPDKLGTVLAELASDPSQPRVRPGAPPDAGADMLERGSSLLSNWLRTNP
jgi:hypothetical protein